MIEFKSWFVNQEPIMQALIAGLFTWILTAVGAGLVFSLNHPIEKY